MPPEENFEKEEPISKEQDWWGVFSEEVKERFKPFIKGICVFIILCMLNQDIVAVAGPDYVSNLKATFQKQTRPIRRLDLSWVRNIVISLFVEEALAGVEELKEDQTTNYSPGTISSSQNFSLTTSNSNGIVEYVRQNPETFKGTPDFYTFMHTLAEKTGVGLLSSRAWEAYQQLYQHAPEHVIKFDERGTTVEIRSSIFSQPGTNFMGTYFPFSFDPQKTPNVNLNNGELWALKGMFAKGMEIKNGSVMIGMIGEKGIGEVANVKLHNVRWTDYGSNVRYSNNSAYDSVVVGYNGAFRESSWQNLRNSVFIGFGNSFAGSTFKGLENTIVKGFDKSFEGSKFYDLNNSKILGFDTA
ncbi:MAG: hypothetical protein NC935_08920, partial [Candidatus Omnitrophica bacterium]|nr:hypothetical protein [Candidatus Omnitrophota bacterium]